MISFRPDPGHHGGLHEMRGFRPKEGEKAVHHPDLAEKGGEGCSSRRVFWDKLIFSLKFRAHFPLFAPKNM